jgi:hypothetical protein
LRQQRRGQGERRQRLLQHHECRPFNRAAGMRRYGRCSN